MPFPCEPIAQRDYRPHATHVRRTAVRDVLVGVCFVLAAAMLYGEEPEAREPELSEAAKQVVYPEGPERMEPLARRSPLEFLRTSLRWYEEHVTGYTCCFRKTERIRGKLQKSEATWMKFRQTPFSVYLKWIGKVAKGREAIYVEHQNDGKAVVHPSGLLGILFRRVKLDPNGKTAMKHSRRPITFAGLANMLRLIIPQCEEAEANGDLTLEYLGIRDNAGRLAYVFNRILPEGRGYPCHQVLIYIDQQFLLPVRTDAYDWNGQLISQYEYTDLELNPDLADEDFDPDNREYGFRFF